MQKSILVGDKKQLLFDDRFVLSANGIEQCMNPIDKKELVLESEMPWESNRVLLISVLENEKQYLMYYSARETNAQGGFDSYLCIAKSQDGVNWNKPELGIYNYMGSKKNNIIAKSIIGAPFYDPNTPLDDPYIMLASYSPTDDPDAFKPSADLDNPDKINSKKDSKYGMISNCIYIFSSKDGIRWEKKSGPVMDLVCDCWSNQILYDHDLKKYVAYLRGFDGKRNVVRYETDNPLKTPWVKRRNDATPGGYGEYYITNEMPIVMKVDDKDYWPGDLQNPGVFKYPWAQDAYLSISGLNRYYPGPIKGDIPNNVGARHRYRFFNDGPNDIHLFVSRNGKEFSRPSRWPYINLGIWGEKDGGALFSGLGMICHKNELWQYYTASKGTHGRVLVEEKNTMGIYRGLQRLDGFVSVNADYHGGEFTTPSLVFKGCKLKLNIDCGGMGEAYVEIQDEIGNLLPGYALEDCDPIDLNNTDITVSWKNNSDVSKFQNIPIRLRFKMRLSKLYSFKFVKLNP